MKPTYLFSLVIMIFLLLSCGDKTVLPELTTVDISDITPTSAICGGSIISDGGEILAACGVCWSVNPSPEVSDNKTVDENNDGSFQSIMTGLTPETKYYVRAYATNSAGTGYGNELTYTTDQECALICDIDTETFSIGISCESGGYSTSFFSESTSYQYDDYGRMSGITKELNRTRTYLNTNNTYTIVGIIEVNLLQNTETHDITVSGGKFTDPQICN